MERVLLPVSAKRALALGLLDHFGHGRLLGSDILRETRLDRGVQAGLLLGLRGCVGRGRKRALGGLSGLAGDGAAEVWVSGLGPYERITECDTHACSADTSF